MIGLRILLPLAGLLALSACEFGPKVTTQSGPNGAGINQIHTASYLRKVKAANYIPPPAYPLETREGPLATSQYENIQVLNDLSAEEFNRLMISITEWVAPVEQGCNYCHNPENMASDEVYQKGVARRMIQMTRAVNQNWKSHVQGTGVTCWTCHRGKGVPTYAWAASPPEPAKLMGNKRGQNTPSGTTAFASLPGNIFEPYLLNASNVRVQSPNEYGPGAAVPIQNAEFTYSFMNHFSKSLGVNCTYCHNSNNFASWDNASPQRALAWYAIRMSRDINKNYIQPLKPVFPASGLGPMGDPWKVNCATCHQGANKPLNGVSMLPDHPSMAGPRPGYNVPTGPIAAMMPPKTGG